MLQLLLLTALGCLSSMVIAAPTAAPAALSDVALPMEVAKRSVVARAFTPDPNDNDMFLLCSLPGVDCTDLATAFKDVAESAEKVLSTFTPQQLQDFNNTITAGIASNKSSDLKVKRAPYWSGWGGRFCSWFGGDHCYDKRTITVSDQES